MKIKTNIEMSFSLNELKKMVADYNENIYFENKKQIEKIIENNLCREFPNDISIHLDDLENSLFIYADFKNALDLMSIVKNHAACIFSLEQMRLIEDADDGIISIYVDDNYSQLLFALDFEDLEY